jgi:hypothetical protein
LWLPDELTEKFRQTVAEFEEEKHMPYVTSIERLGKQEGLQEATREAVVEILKTRFAAVPPAILDALNRLDDLGTLRALLRRAITVERPEELGLAF